MKKKIKFYFAYIAAINIIFFVMQLIIPGFTGLMVLNKSALYGFQVWRFVTAMFVHGGVMHLVLNLFSLLLFGIILESTIGSRRFLTVYLVSGILGNIIAVNFYDSSLGASGAIYGVIGAVTVLRPMMMIWAFGIMMPMFIAAIAWIIADVLRMLGAFGETNIGSIAHLSGIVAGIFFGFYYRSRFRIKKKRNDRLHIHEKDIENWEDYYMR